MRLKQRYALIALLVCTNSTTNLTASANVLDLAMVGFVTESLGGILDDQWETVIADIEKSVEDFSSRAAQEGNILVLQAGNEMRLAIGMVEAILDDQRELTVRELDQVGQRLVSQLLRLRQDMNEGALQLKQISDLATLDIKALADSVPGITLPFHIHEVQNLIVKPDTGRTLHEITVLGPNFGQRIDDEQIEFSFRLNGLPIETRRFSDGTRHGTVVLVDTNVIDTDQATDGIQTHELSVEAKRTSSKWYAPLCLSLCGEKVEMASMSLQLIQIPEIVGTIKFTQRIPLYEFQALDGDDRFVSSTIDVLSDRRLDLNVPNPLSANLRPNDQRFIEESLKVACNTDIRDFYVFRDTRRREVSDPMFSTGWTHPTLTECLPSRSTGSININNGNTLKAIADFRAMTGFPRRRTIRPFLTSEETNPDGLCFVPATVLTDWVRRFGTYGLEPQSIDTSSCGSFTYEDPTLNARRDQYSVQFRGRAPQSAEWSIRARMEQYLPTGEVEEVESEEIKVTYGLNEIDVPKNDQAVTLFTFIPSIILDPELGDSSLDYENLKTVFSFETTPSIPDIFSTAVIQSNGGNWNYQFDVAF